MTGTATATAPKTGWLELLGAPMRQRFVDAEGIRTRILEAGEGPALVLLHGTAGHAEAYLRNLRGLSEHFRVIAVDMLGHGFTDKPDYPYTPPVYARHLNAVLDALGVGRAHISGESLGAWVAAWTAYEFPHRVNRLVLNTPGNITNKPEVMTMIRDTSLRAVREASPESVRARLSWLFAERNRGMITDEIVDIRYAIYTQPDFRRSIEHILAMQDPETRAQFAWDPTWVSQIRQPTLVLWTTEDPTGSEEEGQLLQSWLANSELRVIEGAGHWPQWELPDAFAQLHVEFLKPHENRP